MISVPSFGAVSIGIQSCRTMRSVQSGIAAEFGLVLVIFLCGWGFGIDGGRMHDLGVRQKINH